MSDSLAELLQPPGEEPPSHRWWLRAVVGAGLVVAGVVMVLVARGADRSDASSTSSDATTSSASASTTAYALEQVSFDPTYLFYPLVLPSGADLCESPSGQSARFCLAGGDVRVIVQMQEVSPSRMAAGVPVPGWSPARWLDLGDTPTLAVMIDGVMGLTITAIGISEQQLVEVARSVPLVADPDLFRLDTTNPLDPFAPITDETAAVILGIDVSDVYHGSSGWVPRTNTDNLRLEIDSSDSLLSYAATMRYPRMVDGLAFRAVGGMGTGSQEQISRITWSQRGLVWTLQSTRSLDDLTELVQTAIEIISEL